MKKLRYLTYLVILLVFVLSTTAVLEAANVDEELDWPKRTITIVVPFGTGEIRISTRESWLSICQKN